jgi:glucose/arabinose dehydrogenase
MPAWARVLVASAGAAAALFAAGNGVAALPAGFQETVAFSGLSSPTAVRFAADGRVFVAEKSGLIKVFDNLNDTSPTVFADLSTNVYNFWDRGLLGLALDPQFTNGRPYVYTLYAHDAAIGGTAPRWGTPGVLSDPCPTPPGPTGDGCVVSGRLARLTANGNTAVPGSHSVLIEDWCQQYPSHSIGNLAFGADGALYVSGGDGASFNFTDWGQDGSPLNPCGDPPTGVGTPLTPPTAEGGALRSQDLRTTGDPTSLDGTILRVDPNTGNGLLDNPLASSLDPNARRIVAQGLRNPFRITVRPGTSDVWVGDVGWNDWEEINRLGPLSTVTNFGWPCYEGNGRQPGYDGANLNICEALYGQAGAVTPPFYTYAHSAKVVTGETCPTGGSSISGLAFYNGGTFPAQYNGALFFSDYSRNCIWVMFPGSNGLPNPSNRATFLAPAAGPVDLQVGPGGALYYADLNGGTIRRISAVGANNPPTAVISASPTNGPAPLTVQFDGRGSSDPDGDTITYAWDLDGDGAFDDSTSPQTSWTYPVGTFTARLRVTDPSSASGTASVVINSGNTLPSATISTPSPSTLWRVGDTIGFSGSATDQQDGTIPASRLSWSLDLRHCFDLDSCHTHHLQDFNGVASGSFTAPDHEYPSHLLLTLTAADAQGATDSETVRLDPRTVDLTFASQPSGLQLAVGGASSGTPFTKTVIVGSTNSVSAPSPQSLGAASYRFVSWSDGGAAAHTIVAPATATTYTANYEPAGPSGLVAAYSADAGTGTTLADVSGNGNTATITGATWSGAGRFGGALSFDGVNDWATVADAAPLDLTAGMTLEAWVRPSSVASWQTVLLKEQPGNLVYALYGSTDTNRPSGHVNVGGDLDTRGPATLPANAWTHLAATYDGATLRLYVNGTQASSRAVPGSMVASTGALRIGGNSVWGEWFAGLIDEIRIYNRALSATEVQNDMNTSVGAPPPPPPPDTQPPSAPTLSVQDGLSSTTLNWTASTDNVGLDHYDVHRSTVAAFVPSAANRIAQLSVTNFTDSGLAPGVYFYRVVAYDAAGNSAASNEASGTVTGDATAPTVAITAPAEGATVSGSVTITATASDNVGVVGVQFKVDGLNVGAEDTSAPYSAAWDTTTAANGSHEVTAEARDAAGNRRTSSIVPVTVDNTAPPPAAGLVGAYSFNEGTGTTLTDRSGTGNNGTISGATWSAAGRNGGALSFDGVNDQVTVADASSLDVPRMTLGAWVFPTALGGLWRTVLLKEQPGQLAYALYANTDTSRPSGHVYVGGDRDVRGTAALPTNAWTHLAATYDGSTLRLYVNGVQASSLSLVGSILTSSGALRLGGNTVWGEWFAGRLDDVRIYNRALSAAEVQADMNRAVTP